MEEQVEEHEEEHEEEQEEVQGWWELEWHGWWARVVPRVLELVLLSPEVRVNAVPSTFDLGASLTRGVLEIKVTNCSKWCWLSEPYSHACDCACGVPEGG